MKHLLLFLITINLTIAIQAQTQLDDWTSTSTMLSAGPQAGAGTYSKTISTTGTGIYGGSRDVKWDYTAVSAVDVGNSIEIGPSFLPGTYNISGTFVVTAYKVTVTYDGTANGVLDAATGLGGVDMTGTGVFKTTLQHIESLTTDNYINTTFRVYSDATHYSDASYNIIGPATAPTSDIVISKTASDFSAGVGAAGPANFTHVTAVQLITDVNDPWALDMNYGDGFWVPSSHNISGNVFHDIDAGNVNNSAGITNVIPSGLYAYLIGPDGKVAAIQPVNTDGTFSFANTLLITQNYTVSISTTTGTIGSTPPSITLPSGWVSTGEFNGAPNTGNDGIINSTSSVFGFTGATDVTNINFGINQSSSLPVVFGTIQATISENQQLAIDFTSEKEINVDHYDIEASTDKVNFKKIGSLTSLAPNGNSTSSLSYQFKTGNNSKMGVWGIGGFLFLISLLWMTITRRRRIKLIPFLCSIIFVLGLLANTSCTKKDLEANNSNKRVWVRIVQIDKNGGKQYSRIVEAINKN